MTAHDLPILLDRASELPLAAQLATALRRAILDGILRHDEALPSTRALAASVRVSRGTVVAAYDQLAGEGYLLARPGSATRVRVERHEALTDAVRDQRGRPLRGRATPSATGTGAAGAARTGEASSAPTPPPLIDLAPGHPSTRSLVDPAWTAAWRAAVAASGRSDSPSSTGTLELRTAIAEHVRRARGLACRPEDVIVTAGTSDALASIGLALAALAGDANQPRTRPTPRIAVEDPGYPTARRVLTRVGAHLDPVHTDESGINLTELAALTPPPHAVLVTPSHQYPLGSSLSVQGRLDLLEWARAADAVVIEDDYDSEFRFGTSPLPALATLDSSGRVALVGSFSKTVTPWIRCGYIVATGDLGAALTAVRADLGPSVSGVQQAALAHYLDSGGLARNITRVRREYAHRRALVIDALGALPGVRLSGLDGGLHVVVHLSPPLGAGTKPSTGTDASALVTEAAARGVRVALLADYAVIDRGQHGLVLGYGAPTDLELGRAVAVLAGLLTEHAAG
ncbi:PLP-dependent aminotransferase family protein [Cryobacterium sp. 1639]|uniref:MocR-like pyridoxine biosynthesis transcription factor PdxR n=1 Tax=Cryobacterium inferilacus TaxID=2866629 RepID=UPI001C73072B|nr:PLP-dependent aminotransferase family protein [Cryobacterium sp. 1639]MBX0301281.1 PLP-dependent aminotransferase family protein [Cryobacterium sp. 1639]